MTFEFFAKYHQHWSYNSELHCFKFGAFFETHAAIPLLHPHTHPPLQLNLPISLIKLPHLNPKYLGFFSTALASSLTLIRSPPGFWKYVLLSLLLPLPTLSICLSPQVSSILFSTNLLSPHFDLKKPTLDKTSSPTIPANLQPVSHIQNNRTDRLVSSGRHVI